MSTGKWITVACVAFFGTLLIGAGVVAEWLRMATQVVFAFNF